MSTTTEFLVPTAEPPKIRILMTRADMLPHLQRWQQQMGDSDHACETCLEPLRLSPESPLYAAIWALQGALTAAVAHIVGDHQYNWLSWYAAENEMGHIGLEAGPVNDAKPIRTIEDLAWLIEVTR